MMEGEVEEDTLPRCEGHALGAQETGGLSDDTSAAVVIGR
jgi:hypothetical protein